MPEGHVIHRLANHFNELFLDQRLAVSSPQGRFSQSAALLDRSLMKQAQAWGKHLFVRFHAPIAQPILHIHLGLIGQLTFTPLAPPVGQVRVRLSDAHWAADLRGPQRCQLISADEQLVVTTKLGADPLRDDADPQQAWTKVHRSSKTIAALLMDQSIFAGVGNIYRVEILFRHRIKPSCPGNKLRKTSFEAIWDDLVTLMKLGVRDGRVDTVFPEHTPEAMNRPPRVDAHGGEVYAYRRAGQPCLVCGATIRMANLQGRNLFWCGHCQRRY